MFFLTTPLAWCCGQLYRPPAIILCCSRSSNYRYQLKIADCRKVRQGTYGLGRHTRFSEKQIMQFFLQMCFFGDTSHSRTSPFCHDFFFVVHLSKVYLSKEKIYRICLYTVKAYSVDFFLREVLPQV